MAAETANSASHQLPSAGDAPASSRSLSPSETEQYTANFEAVANEKAPIDESSDKRDQKDKSFPAAPTHSLAHSAKEDDVVAAVNEDGRDDVQGEEEERSGKYLTGPSLILLTFGLCLCTFVVALDNSIVATAIPTITTDFQSFVDAGWYGSSYLLTTTALQPSFGKIFTYFDVKWTYLSAVVIFEIGSIVCATAPNSEALIVGRAIAGGGAAALFSGGMTIVGYSVPLAKRPIFIALLSSMFGISSVVGPILGGAFTDRLTWRWCFWINLPIGGVAIAAVFFFFTNPERQYSNMSFKEKIKQIDVIGAFFLICAVICILLALQWGGTVYEWSDSRVWGMILGFGFLTIVFIIIQFWRDEMATLPPRILRQRTVLASALMSVFLSMALYSHIFYLPYYFQSVKGTTAEASGIRCIPYLVSTTIGSIVAGSFITITGIYVPFLWVGSAIFTIGCGLIYTLQLDSTAGHWIGYQILAGLGAGICVQIPFIAVQVVLSEKDMPVGNSIAIFSNSFGGAIAISIAQNIFANTLGRELGKRAPGVDARTIIAAGATQLRGLVREPVVLQQVLIAYLRGITTAFIMPIAVAGMAFCVSFLFEWRSAKGKKLGVGAAA